MDARKRVRPQPIPEANVPSAEPPHPEYRKSPNEWLTATAASGLRHQPVWASAVLGLQRSAGNEGVTRALARGRLPAVQRQGSDRSAGPQLETSGIRSSVGWRPPANADSPYRLHLNPEIEAQLRALQVMRALVGPQQVSAGLDQLTLPTIPPELLTPRPNAPAIPTPQQPSATTAPGPAPGTELTGPRPGTGGDIWRAIRADPAIGPAVLELGDRVVTRARQDWQALSGGGQVALVSAALTIGGGAVTGVLSSPEARSWVATNLSGKVLPVPLVPGLGVQLNLRTDNVLLGLHLDVGKLLPQALGFGPAASTSPLGAPLNPYAPTH